MSQVKYLAGLQTFKHTLKTNQKRDQHKSWHICFSHFSVSLVEGAVILNYNISLFCIYHDTKKAKPISPNSTHSNTGKIKWKNVIMTGIGKCVSFAWMIQIWISVFALTYPPGHCSALCVACPRRHSCCVLMRQEMPSAGGQRSTQESYFPAENTMRHCLLSLTQHITRVNGTEAKNLFYS